MVVTITAVVLYNRKVPINKKVFDEYAIETAKLLVKELG